MLAGKYVWIWNLARCDGGELGTIVGRLKSAGCAGAIVKAWDGVHSFTQRSTAGVVSAHEIADVFHESGLKIATWGYCYGRAPADEAAVASVVSGDEGTGRADAIVLDVEAEYKGKTAQARRLCEDLRRYVPNVPLLYSSFAIARYHREFPFEVFNELCNGALPQVYWNAFRWSWAHALGWTYEDYAAMGLGPGQALPAAGLYTEGYVQYPMAADVREFIAAVREAGSPGCSFWSYEHMNQAMWDAVAAVQWPVEGMPWTGWKEEQMSFTEEDRAKLDAILERTRDDLVKVRGTDRVYQVVHGKKLVHVLDPERLVGMRGSFGDVQEVEPDSSLLTMEAIYPGGVPPELRR